VSASWLLTATLTYGIIIGHAVTLANNMKPGIIAKLLEKKWKHKQDNN
jgi:hypothetical protein